MHYLIDGHNLIANLDSIDLADPDDEAQLVLRLRSWVAAGRKRRVTVFFDGGLPGGRSPHFSRGPVQVVFAPAGTPADDLIVGRIRKLRNPPEYTVVSSDREIVAAAAKRKVGVILAETFAVDLEAEAVERARPATPAAAEAEPLLDEAEVAEWLELFGPEPEIPARPRRRRKAPPAGEDTVQDEPAPRAADELKDSEGVLTDKEVAEWLALFGAEESEKKR